MTALYDKGEYMDYIAMGKRVKDIRKRKGITQERLAELTGLSSAHISNIENAHTKVSLSSVVSIANALQISLDEIMCDSLEKSISTLVGGRADSLAELSIKEARILGETIDAMKKSFIKNRK